MASWPRYATTVEVFYILHYVSRIWQKLLIGCLQILQEIKPLLLTFSQIRLSNVFINTKLSLLKVTAKLIFINFLQICEKDSFWPVTYFCQLWNEIMYYHFLNKCITYQLELVSKYFLYAVLTQHDKNPNCKFSASFL